MKNNILTPKYDHNGIFLRKIRSFVCRKGRITTSQLNAIKRYWPLIGIDFCLEPLNFSSIFNSSDPVILEIGFGSGRSLVQTAMNFPDKNFLGIEVYKSGIGSCLNLAYIYKLKNLKIIYYDAIEVINIMILDHTLLTVQIFFPDPWNKKRHKKRRILQSDFLKVLAKKLIFNGILHIVTDSEEYAFYILDRINCIDDYENLSKTNDFVIRPVSRIITDFEKKAHLRGDRVFDLMFQLKIS
ncbi:MAG: tRNA (guanosine(46)-N7)-methyltransferase TrmB [Buchnera aphidicola (Brevicoryne brassicae)]|uniref:tRNA (guanine-N(7)-)-methyltransferase n=1 Tax=Buchnera aphidicola (Brevicoryne brassicae) TaxID=911343 RepID=A0AAJ5PUK2_9GAMM|nr:tRNA (guanosine(46)-N7)-methyltransferase TrmB [Buchnera aphidicola]QCI20092.1 tRNA (guanosine(46)-N7)-methyltransferase TrmB [Buchnera aphidicola (Brevicoryne brassicae)]WAI18916.1 MAG: tRNA (guanosine(46)-N7)-methyltransferase TrmB [Buchnera aphidicola (Brevicoryne brassicae)]